MSLILATIALAFLLIGWRLLELAEREIRRTRYNVDTRDALQRRELLGLLLVLGGFLLFSVLVVRS